MTSCSVSLQQLKRSSKYQRDLNSRIKYFPPLNEHLNDLNIFEDPGMKYLKTLSDMITTE